MCHRQVDKDLVITVAAGNRGFASGWYRLRHGIKAPQHLSGRVCRVGGVRWATQPRNNLWIRQHAGQLVAHGRGGDPAQTGIFHCVQQRCAGRVLKHQQIQHHIGVQDQGPRCASRRGEKRFRVHSCLWCRGLRQRDGAFYRAFCRPSCRIGTDGIRSGHSTSARGVTLSGAFCPAV